MTMMQQIQTLRAIFRRSNRQRSSTRRRIGDLAALDRLEGRTLMAYVPDWSLGVANVSEYVFIESRSVAVDPAGNSYVVGSFSGTADFDPNASPADGSDILASRSFIVDNHQRFDAFVAKYAPDGLLVWVRGFGGEGDEWGMDIALDAAGHIYLTGTHTGTGHFGLDSAGTPVALTEAGHGDVFVAKLNPDGSTAWARSMGGDGKATWAKGDLGPAYFPEKSGGIGVDAAGNVFTSGTFVGTADFDKTSTRADNSDLLTSAGGQDVFVTKHAPDGSLLWVKRIGNDRPSEAGGLAVDAAGAVVLTGRFWDRVDFDPGPGTSNLSVAKFSGGFVVKLDASGSFAWANKVGYTARDVAIDPSGNVLATGGGTTAGTGFVAKYTPAGRSTWTMTFGVDTNGFGGESIAVDAAGNSYVTGSFSRTVDMDPGRGTYSLTAQGDSDAFLLVLNASGGFLTAVSLSTPPSEEGSYRGADLGYGIAVDAAGNVSIVGRYSDGRTILRKLKKI